MTYIESMRNFVRQSKQRPEMEQPGKDVWGTQVVRLFEKDGVVSKEIVPLECWFVQYEVQSGDTIQAVKRAGCLKDTEHHMQSCLVVESIPAVQIMIIMGIPMQARMKAPIMKLGLILI